MEETIGDMVATFCPAKTKPREWNWADLPEDFYSLFFFHPQLPDPEASDLNDAVLEKQLLDQVRQRFEEREREFTPEVTEKLVTMLLLQVIDSQWKDHLLSLDHLREGIGLRGYGQKNPKEEYKKEAYSLFMEMMGRIRQEFLGKLFRVQLASDSEMEQARREEERRRKRIFDALGAGQEGNRPVTRHEEKVGRNDPCPCGSGKKFKKCCGK